MTRKPHLAVFWPLAVCAALLLSGCGFAPLYGARDGRDAQAALAAMEVARPKTRLEQLIRNAIISHAPPGDRKARYRLEISARERISALVENVNTASDRERYRLTATFRLVDINSGASLITGTSFSHVSYDRVDAPFANLSAEANARERAARAVADDIRLRLAAFFHGAH